MMKENFRLAYRAFRCLGNNPDWKAFDAATASIPLPALVAAGIVRNSVIHG